MMRLHKFNLADVVLMVLRLNFNYEEAATKSGPLFLKKTQRRAINEPLKTLGSYRLQCGKLPTDTFDKENLFKDLFIGKKEESMRALFMIKATSEIELKMKILRTPKKPAHEIE